MIFGKRIVLRREIRDLYKAGTPKKEIFEKVKAEYEELGEEYIAGLVAAAVPEELFAKYGRELFAAKALLLGSILLFIYFPAPAPGLIRYFMLAATIVAVFLWSVEFKNFNAYHLVGLNIIALFFLAILIVRGIFLANPLVIAGALVPTAAVYFIRLLRKKLIPHIPFRGKIRKDSDGEYIFD